MSGPYRKILGPALGVLREKMNEAQGIVEAQGINEEGLKQLRKLRIHIRKKVEHIEKVMEEWRKYMTGLDEDAKQAEERIFDQFEHQEVHIGQWVTDAYDLLTEIDIRLAEEDDKESDKKSTHSNSTIEHRNGEKTKEKQQKRRSGLEEEEDEEPNEDNDLKNYRKWMQMGTNMMQTPPISYPKMPWPIFYGDPLAWPAFWQAFSANAGDKKIATVQKCSYLIMSLKGKAARAVKGYLPTAENYLPIIDTLKRQFGDGKVIRESLQNELLTLPQANESIGSLRGTMEEIERICRQLDNFGIFEGDADFLLMSIKSKFPRSIVLEALKSEKSEGLKWDLETWRSGLNDVISLREEASRCTKAFGQSSAYTGNGFIQKNFSGNFFNKNQGYKSYRDRDRESYRDRDRDRYKEVETRRAFSALRVNSKEGRVSKQTTPRCFFCGNQHWAADCRKVVNREARIRMLQEQKRCLKCLRRGHEKFNCNGKNCANCNEEHHKAICPRGNKRITFLTGGNKEDLGKIRYQIPPTPVTQNSSNAVTTLSAEDKNGDESLLMTARAKICAGKTILRSASALAFFDTGSQISFISDKLIRKLSPQKINDGDLELLPFRQKSPTRIKSPKYLITINLKDGGKEDLIVSRIDYMTKKLKRVEENSGNARIIEEEPDLLIGIDDFWKFVKGKPYPISDNLYRIEKTLGPIVCGHLKGPNWDNRYETMSLLTKDQKEEEIDKMWALETIGIVENPAEKDDEIAQKFFNEIVKKRDGRYVVKWPWKGNKELLPTNFAMAYRRLVGLLQRSGKTPEQLNALDEIFKENLKENIIEKCEIKSFGEHFLPHHCVFAKGKKPRIVYDGSAKVRGSKSLNDMLFRGPIDMPQIPGMLVRARVPKIALWSDIQRAFWTLELESEDREFVKFLWVRNVTEPISQDNLLVLRFCRVPFGIISSPFLLSAAVHHHLKREGTELAKEVERNLFVDNIFVGCDNKEEALRKYEKLKKLFAEVKMNLREFVSNSKEVNEKIPEGDQLGKDKPKILGINWDLDKDEFYIEFPDFGNSTEGITRRKVLKELNSVYDPCGWASPSLLPSKLFLQKLWDGEKKWDDRVAQEEREKWRELTEGWKGISLNLGRRIISGPNDSIQLHIFVDASKEAYATCVYCRSEGEEKQILINLLYARSRLKPKKMAVSIPRMELLGALIGARAGKFIENELNLKVEGKFLWCDSKPVLYWIKNKGEQPRFVENRLKEIKENIGLECRYVPTEDNPADVASRGCTPQDLKYHPLWWHGPPWLKGPKWMWPDDIVFKIELNEEGERENTENLNGLTNMAIIKEMYTLIDFEKYSSWDELVIITVSVMKMGLKWLNKIKRKPDSIQLKSISEGKFIMPNDFETAEKFLWKQGQIGWENYAANNIQIRWKKDKDELIRLDSRIGNSQMQENFNFPLAFPKGSPILKLLIWKSHIRVFHQKVDSTLNNFFAKFWAPGIRGLTKNLLKSCSVCKRNSGPSFALPPMADHPEQRVRQSRPFEHIAIDYLGPSIAKKEKGKKEIKYWIALFTCLVTRGVYLEPIFDLTSESFLQVLRRFSSRRGRPKSIISDNAQTFKLAAKIAGTCDSNKIKGESKLENFLIKEKIEWRFIPALAPWENGLAERLVKLVKDSFKSALGRIILGQNELYSFTAEVEAMINSRPLTYVSGEPDKLMALRPIDFISPGTELGINIINEEEKGDEEYRIGPPKLEDELRKRWKKVNKALNIFWERWQKEYLVLLRNRNNWLHKGPRAQEFRQPKLGEAVIVMEELRPRNTWPLGKIVELIGKSDAIRSVRLKMANGRIIQRPVNKIVPLEASNEKQIGIKEWAEGKNKKDEKGIERDEEEAEEPINGQMQNVHPMVTRAKGRKINANFLTIASLLLIFIGGVFEFVNGGANNFKKCLDCEWKCESKGVSVKIPLRMNKLELCCFGSCFTHSSPGEILFSLPRDQLLVEHLCTANFWSKRGIRYRNKIKCPPIDKCQMDGILNWDRLLNRQCWNFWVEIAITGTLVVFCLVLKCLIMCILSVRDMTKCLISCIFSPFRLCWYLCGKFQKGGKDNKRKRKPERVGKDQTERIELMERNKSEREDKERERRKRQNRRLDRLGMATIFGLIVLINMISTVDSGAEVAVVQAQSEDCVNEKSSKVCRIRGSAQMSILPAGQDVKLAFKNNLGVTVSSLEIGLDSLSLICTQETVSWHRSYKIEVRHARRCPSMGTCKVGKCDNVRKNEQIEELKEYWDYPGNSYCLGGKSIWGQDCAIPTSLINECYFYKIMAIPATTTVWREVKCLGWDYQIKVNVKLESENKTLNKMLLLYPGFTETWNNVAITVKGATPPISPVHNGHFFISNENDEIIFEDKEIKDELVCKGPEKAQNFECELGSEACIECWLNSTDIETKVDCECRNIEYENLGTKLPFTTDKLNLREEQGNIFSESKYAPIELLIRVDNLKIVSEIEGTKCSIEPFSLEGCYDCTTGANFTYACYTEFGKAITEIKCENGLMFLGKCSQDGELQSDILPFQETLIDMTCTVYCAGGISNFSMRGLLEYVPLNEQAFRERISEGTSQVGTVISIKDFFEIDWRNYLLPKFDTKNLLTLVVFAIFGLLILYIILKFSPWFKGYRILARTIFVIFIFSQISYVDSSFSTFQFAKNWAERPFASSSGLFFGGGRIPLRKRMSRVEIFCKANDKVNGPFLKIHGKNESKFISYFSPVPEVEPLKDPSMVEPRYYQHFVHSYIFSLENTVFILAYYFTCKFTVIEISFFSVREFAGQYFVQIILILLEILYFFSFFHSIWFYIFFGSEIAPFQTMWLTEFICDKLGCEQEQVGRVLDDPRKWAKANGLLCEALKNGAKLFYEGQFNDQILSDMPSLVSMKWEYTPLPDESKNWVWDQIKVIRNRTSKYGPGVVSRARFFPLSGLKFQGYEDSYDSFGEFYNWQMGGPMYQFFRLWRGEGYGTTVSSETSEDENNVGVGMVETDVGKVLLDPGYGGHAVNVKEKKGSYEPNEVQEKESSVEDESEDEFHSVEDEQEAKNKIEFMLEIEGDGKEVKVNDSTIRLKKLFKGKAVIRFSVVLLLFCLCGFCGLATATGDQQQAVSADGNANAVIDVGGPENGMKGPVLDGKGAVKKGEEKGKKRGREKDEDMQQLLKYMKIMVKTQVMAQQTKAEVASPPELSTQPCSSSSVFPPPTHSVNFQNVSQPPPPPPQQPQLQQPQLQQPQLQVQPPPPPTQQMQQQQFDLPPTYLPVPQQMHNSAPQQQYEVDSAPVDWGRRQATTRRHENEPTTQVRNEIHRRLGQIAGHMNSLNNLFYPTNPLYGMFFAAFAQFVIDFRNWNNNRGDDNDRFRH